MQIEINKLTLAKVFELSQFIKEKCKDASTMEEAAQELTKILYQTFVTDSSKSAVVLARFFKSCSYCDLPDDIRGYITQKEGKTIIPPQNKYLILLGTWGDLEVWRQREKSENYKAFSLTDLDVLSRFPMISAVLSQIGFKIPTETEIDKNIIVDKQDISYGLFYVEDAKSNKLISKQAEFVAPFGIKSVLGFGSSYVSTDIYTVIIFFRESINRRIAKLFLSLNPAVKLLTLRHDITKNICLANKRISNPSDVLTEINNLSDSQKVEYVVRSQEARVITDELKKANEALFELTKVLNEKNVQLTNEITRRKKIEKDLKKSEATFRSLIDDVLDNSTVGIFILDENFRIVWVNKSLELYFGLCRKEIIGKDKRQTIREKIIYIFEDQEAFTEKVFATYDNNTYAENFECHVLPEGKRKERWLLHDSMPIKSGLYAGGRIEHYHDITERKRAEEKLATYQTRLKRLSSALSLTAERERRHIAEDLHDRIGQALTVIKMKLEELKNPQVDTDSGRVLNETGEILDNAIQDTRTLTFEISPPLLYELGFESAVEWLIEQFMQRHNIPIEYEVNGNGRMLDDDVSFFLFKSVRELLFNAIKYARADRIKVSVRRGKSKIRISIQDDGVGFDFSKVKFSVNSLNGFGLFSMRERMEHFGGNFDVESKPGQGTRITLKMPLKPQEESWVKWIKQ